MPEDSVHQQDVEVNLLENNAIHSGRFNRNTLNSTAGEQLNGRAKHTCKCAKLLGRVIIKANKCLLTADINTRGMVSDLCYFDWRSLWISK